MSVKVFITIDAEEDDWGVFTPDRHSVVNISELPMLQGLFDKYGAIPTYLITWPVASHRSSRKIIRSLVDSNRCEIGTHCHPWNTPPYEEKLGKGHSMMCNLPSELLTAKMAHLHELIVDELKVTPICFRAGRWGFGNAVAKCIHNLGYKVDTSICPFVDWSAEGGPDFTGASTFSYRFDPDDILTRKAAGSMLEVPPTIGFYQRNFKLCHSVRTKILNGPFSNYHILGVLDRLRVLNFRWLSPELSNGSEMVHLAKRFVRSGHRFLNMSFHSTSLVPAKGPFVCNTEQLSDFLARIESFLMFARNQGFTFAPLRDALNTLP